MNKEEAIKWCEEHLKKWPDFVRSHSPKGWNWRVKNKPFSLPDIILQSATETITSDDVSLNNK